jgi:hypothetical protein
MPLTFEVIIPQFWRDVNKVGESTVDNAISFLSDLEDSLDVFPPLKITVGNILKFKELVTVSHMVQCECISQMLIADRL